MNKNIIYVLVHSPLVGSLTWTLVADQMQQRGLKTIVPALVDSPEAGEPYWKQHAESVARALALVPEDTLLILVAHSGAGPLLPAIRQSLVNPVHAYIFVDAGLPPNGASRLDSMKSENPEWAGQFQEELERGGNFPNWSFEDLKEVLPDESLRQKMIAEIHPRELAFFTEQLPMFAGWPDAPCIYIQFSAPYQSSAVQARRAGWQIYELAAGHFHMLVDPKAVADLLVEAVNRIPS
ncbi:MAG TPA: alpha/beta fold hydrolase [Anaerolineales bacterium]|nr:alpha/beta fold hydrolase [Anaerolineales bacterium]